MIYIFSFYFIYIFFWSVHLPEAEFALLVGPNECLFQHTLFINVAFDGMPDERVVAP